MCSPLYGPIVERDLCAHPIRVKYSGCACADDDTDMTIGRD